METKVVNIKRQEYYDIFIGRPSVWGNPFQIGRDGDRKEVVEKYREYILNRPALLAMLPELKGKILGCFCKPHLCHGDVLIQLIKERC